jgi:hypothetical protein
VIMGLESRQISVQITPVMRDTQAVNDPQGISLDIYSHLQPKFLLGQVYY